MASFGRSIFRLLFLALCLTAIAAAGNGSSVKDTCRFAASYAWEDVAAPLLSDKNTQDVFVAAMLAWDGKFATPGNGVTLACVTRDHITVNAAGLPDSRAGYTAASKESLHIGMLALVVARTPLAWHWMPATGPDDAARQAVERLACVMDAYEQLVRDCPGCGGFLPWIQVTDQGFGVPANNVQIPSLDNGQLAWSMVAAQTVLEEQGETVLGARFAKHVQLMAASAAVLFLRRNGGVSTSARISNVSAPVSEANRVVGNFQLADPFEGELMVYFIDLMADGVWNNDTTKLNSDGSNYTRRDRLWKVTLASFDGGTHVSQNYEDARLPNGPITVQSGWRFSSHEQWKYFVLPYLNASELVGRIVRNGERARTWHSKLNGYSGLMGSCYNWKGNYKDIFGIPQLAGGFALPKRANMMATPYGAYPLMLVDRGAGLVWYRSMVGRPRMQSSLGSLEASQMELPGFVAMKYSWDTKVTTNMAVLGGLGAVLQRALQKEPRRWERFEHMVRRTHEPYYPTLVGEETPFAMPLDWDGLPGPNSTESDTESLDPRQVGRDFAACLRLSSRAPVQTKGKEPSPSEGEGEGGLGGGAIAGIIIGVLLGLGGVAAAVYKLRTQSRGSLPELKSRINMSGMGNKGEKARPSAQALAGASV